MIEPAHSELPPSSSDKWIKCFGWLKANRGIESKTSAAAEEGTLAHEHFEKALKGELDLAELENAEMSDYLQSCVDWVDYEAEKMGALYQHAETRVDFGSKFGYVGLTGTADLILVSDDEILIGDLKYGRGLVEAKGNTQMLTYLVGAVEMFGPRKQYTLAILQPRGNHFDGPIRTATVTPDELKEFEAVLEKAIAMNYADGPYTVGAHCRNYCAAIGKCRAVAAHSLRLFQANPIEE
jgi:hypothetical protein